MVNFEVYGKYEIKKEGVTVETIAQLLKTNLVTYYAENKITLTTAGVAVDGNLKSIWERAVTKADVKLKIEGNQLSYLVNGTSSFGSYPYIILVLVFIFLIISDWLSMVMFFWFADLEVTYLFCRNRPKRYFEDAFKAVQFEIG